MATRSLTNVFILMRNNASQNRHFFGEQYHDDRASLVHALKEKDVESEVAIDSRLHPVWITGVEEIQYEYEKIKKKIAEVLSLHDKHLNRPTLDDSIDDERAIESLTKELTLMFGRCHRLLAGISATPHRGGQQQEVLLAKNIQAGCAREMQELSTKFRMAQSSYLKKLKLREERSRGYFDFDIPQVSGVLNQDDTDGLAEYYDKGFHNSNKSPSQQQLLQHKSLELNTALVAQREKEINQIVRSIEELNEIFRDVAQLVVDQGTLVDRIDYNIEHAAIKVECGLQELKKAEKLHKRNLKMYIIAALVAILIILLVILIATKVKR